MTGNSNDKGHDNGHMGHESGHGSGHEMGGWGGQGGSQDTNVEDSFNHSNDDFNLLSGNQVLSGFQLSLIGDNDDGGGAGLAFWS